MTCAARRLYPAVIFAPPAAQPPSVRHSASSPDPAARWMAPSTPPPPSSELLAALTMASTSSRVMSPSTISMRSQTAIHRLRFISSGAPGLDRFRLCGSKALLRHLEIVMGLEVHPEFRAVAEIEREPQGGVGCDASPIVRNIGDPIRRDAD